MSTYILRLTTPRPSFALDMTDEEQDTMGRHAAHWQRYIDSGQMVVFGPVLDQDGSWGLGVLDIAEEDEDELRAHVSDDPVATSGIGTITVGRLLTGFVRPG